MSSRDDVRIGGTAQRAVRARARRPVVIAVYNHRWPRLYATERPRLLQALEAAGFADRIVCVEHIGSTSVPGLGAKPIVDIMIGVRDVEALSTFPRPALVQLGYVPRTFARAKQRAESKGFTLRRLLFTRYGREGVNVHVFVHDSNYWRGHLAVRDLLRASSEARSTYEHVKRTMAGYHRASFSEYGRSKQSFLGSLQAVALGKKRRSRPESAAGDGPAGGGTGPSPTTPMGDPSGWEDGVWYMKDEGALWNEPSSWHVSPNQSPMFGTPGSFAEWNGSFWSVFSSQPAGDPPGAPPPSSPDDSFPEDGVPAEQPYSVEMTREDGSQYVIVYVPPAITDYRIQPNADIHYNDDGSVLLSYNKDGSPWAGPNNDGATGDDPYDGDGGPDAGTYE